MEPIQTPRTCPKCGIDLSADAPEGFCPACLLEAAWREGPAESEAGPSPGEVIEGPGDTIGRYTLRETIGEGGFGVVYMCEQFEPVHRKVALKVIKVGMDTREVIARFDAERQALALMDHPNIARMHEAGATENGRPYFVMELVQGVPITDYCDQCSLTTRERLELFISVCQAVQHAHLKGVIHRDIKPTNVLVAMQDGCPAPKVIDFGVAKAINQRLTEHTLVTAFAHMVGTPMYMSPEQAELSPLGVDTRSDIYSLGVLLYQLLTGTTPFDTNRLKTAAYDELRRIIREEDPPRPSARISTLTAEVATTVAERRRTDSRRLFQTIRGDLDWIVMKAIEKDRTRRYETASALVADTTRYLQEEPVEACPPSAVYRLRKFARRNRQGLAIAGLATVILLTLAGSFIWNASTRAAKQARLAQEVNGALEEIERWEDKGNWPEALAAAKRARSLLAIGERNHTLDSPVHDIVAKLEFLAQLERVRTETKSQVAGSKFDFAGADRAYSETFREFGMNPTNLPVSIRSSSADFRVAFAAALDDWAGSWREVKDEGWEQLVETARTIDPDPWRIELRQAWAKEDTETLERLAGSASVNELAPATLDLLGQALSRAGRREQAASLLRKAQHAHVDDFWINHDLAFELMDAQPARSDEAVGFYRAAVALRPDSPGLRLNLSSTLLEQGKLDEAAAECHEAIRLKPDYAEAHCNLGLTLERQGKPSEAEAEFHEAIRLKPDLANAHINLGNTLERQGKLSEAEAEYCEAIRLKPDFADAHHNLGNTLERQGKLSEAEAEYREAIRLKPDLADAHINLGLTLERQGKPSEAEAEYHEAIRLKPDDAVAHYNLGNTLERQGKPSEAEAEFHEAIRLKPDYAEAHNNLGNTLERQGKLSEAEAEFHEAIRLKPDLANAHYSLGSTLERQGKLDEAAAEFHEAICLKPDYDNAHYRLGKTLQRQGKLDEAAAEFHEAIRLMPDFACSYHNLGQILERMGDLDAAFDAYMESVQRLPEHADHYLSLGSVLAEQKQWDLAIASYSEVIRLDSEVDCAWAYRGNTYARAGRYEQAIADHSKAIELQPGKADYWYARGITYNMSGRYNDAIADYSKAVELQPDHVNAWNNRGIVYGKLKQYDQALADYSKAIAINPEYLNAWLNRASVCRALKQYDQAIAAFSEVIAINPEHVYAWLNRGFLHSKLQQTDQAIADYRQVIRLEPNSTAAHENLAWELATAADAILRDGPQAVIHGNRAIELNPTANNWNNLGVAQYRAGNWEKAVECLEKADSMIEGGDRDHRFFLVMAHWQLGNREQSRHYYSQAIAGLPPDLEKRTDTRADERRRFRAEAEALMGLKSED